MSLPDATREVTSAAVAPRDDRLQLLYGRLLGPMLGGYLLLDRAFAYLHLPGTPLFIGELVLAVGVLGAVMSTRHFVVPIRDEPILSVLVAFTVWGVIRTLPGIATYQLDAIRDAALWYYCLFVFLAAAALSRSPELLERLIHQLNRFVPWLLLWLPVGLVLAPLSPSAPTVPFSTVSVLSHKPGSAATAALLVLGCMWLLPGDRSPRSRAGWSLLALVVIGLAATQNRGGLLGVMAGGAVGLAFVRNRTGLVARAVLVAGLGLMLASSLSLKVPMAGVQGREFSASQLIDNVVSLTGKKSPGNLGGTVDGREKLWSRILAKQISDGRLIHGSGFGQNLATEVGVYDEGKDTLRSPHNSHLHVMARLGVIGISLWGALWIGWYWRMLAGCRRLGRDGLDFRRKIGVICLMVVTAVLVSCFFDPILEGPQGAALLWTAVGIGVAVTSSRPWFNRATGVRS